MTMRALGEPEALELVEASDPTPGPGEIAIDVRAIGCNFFDILLCRGRYQARPPLPFSPGGEVSGTVRSVGPGVERPRPGDRVFAFLNWGGYADVAIARAADAVTMPETMSFEDGAAFGIVYQTSYFGLVHRAALREGETVLVHAAAGGVGLAAVEIAKALGARVLATAGSPEKLAIAERHGADAAWTYDSPDWVERVREATGGAGADVVYDPVGGDVFDLSMRALAFGGRLVVVGFASGRIPTVEANRVLLKNVSIVGLHWGAYRDRDPALVRRSAEHLFELHARGALRPLVWRTYPLREAAAALAEIASRRSAGKVLLVP